MVVISTVGELEVTLGLDKSKFSSGLAAAKTELSNFGSQAESSFSKVGSMVGGALVAGVKVGAVGMAVASGAAVKASADQEQAMMRVSKIMNTSAEDTIKLKNSFRDLANQYGQSTVDIADAGAGLAATGLFKDRAELVKGTEALIRVNSAWGGQMETTSMYLSQVATGYDLDAEAIERYGSAVAVMADETGASEEQIARGTLAFVGLRKDMGLSIDQVNGFTAAFAEIGVQPEEAKTQLKSMFDTFTSGSKPSIEAMKRLGITTEDYNRAVRQGKLPELFALVGSKLKGVTSEMERATLAGNLFGSYGRSMAAALPGMIDTYKEYAEVSRTSYEENTRATEESSKALNTFWGQLSRTKEILVNFAASIGDMGLGPLKDGLYQLNEFMLKAFSGDVKGALQGVKQAIADFDWGSLISTGQAAFNGLMSAIQSLDIGGALARAFTPANIEKAFASLGDMGTTLIGMVTKGLSSIGSLPWESYFSAASSGIQGAMSKIGDAIVAAPWASWAQRAASVLSSALQTAIGAGLNLASWITTKINSIGSGGFETAGRNIAQYIVNGLANIGTYIQQNLGGWLETGLSLAGSAGAALTSFGEGISGVLTPLLKEKGGEIWGGLMDYGSTIAEDAGQLGSDIVQALRSSIAAGAEGILQPIADQFDYLSGKMKELTGYDAGTIGKVDLGGSTAGADRAKVYDSAGKLISDVVAPITNLGKIGQMKTNDKLGISQFSGNPEGALQYLISQGMSFDEAYNTVVSSGIMTSSQTMSKDYMREKYGGTGATTGGIAGGFRLGNLPGLSGMSITGGATGGAGIGTSAQANAYSLGSNANILGILNGGKGASIVPSAASLANANAFANAWTGGTVPVYVTNASEIGGGAGGASGSYGGVQQGVGGKAGGKFNAADMEGLEGPGIGMVGSSNEAYANRLSIETCEIDSFGMTPGLGAELAASGAWKPIQGQYTSMQLAQSIGYEGNYAGDSASSGAVIGKIGKTLDNATKNTYSTGQKVNNLWYSTVASSADTLDMSSQGMGYNIANSGLTMQRSFATVADTNKQSADAVVSTWNFGSVQAGTNISTGGVNANASISQGGVNAKASIETGAATLNTATGQLSTSINNFGSVITEKGVELGNMLGLTSVELGGVITSATGALMAFGGGYVGGYNGGMGANFGTGSFGSSKAAWIGTGASATGWGAQASNYAKSQSAFYTSGYGSGGGGSTAGTSFSFGFAEGGIPTKPMLATVAEDGPEAIIPLNKLPGMIRSIVGGGSSSGGMVHTVINIDGKKIADAVGPAMIQRTRQGAGLHVR